MHRATWIVTWTDFVPIDMLLPAGIESVGRIGQSVISVRIEAYFHPWIVLRIHRAHHLNIHLVAATVESRVYGDIQKGPSIFYEVLVRRVIDVSRIHVRRVILRRDHHAARN